MTLRCNIDGRGRLLRLAFGVVLGGPPPAGARPAPAVCARLSESKPLT